MGTGEWGLFNDESADYTAEEAVEAGFYSKEEAEKALADRYTDEDELEVRECEDHDDEEDDEDEEEADEDEDKPKSKPLIEIL